ncbi:Phospholipase/carboxylesterase [Epithele typhae]|uniref:Phospholipase/carboxylesterase n=1 Tax=Epithele typhae TaxID=378194 RepID=UPI002008E448|nr:Phospholipase/carboxylesterase [Epithele typhae]KAH9939252.1 Phospholipase/carboxylesterase [Epithele typhae]
MGVGTRRRTVLFNFDVVLPAVLVTKSSLFNFSWRVLTIRTSREMEMATTAEIPKFVSVPPRARHTATVIMVHGLGDSGYGWKSVAQMFADEPGLHHVKWVLPHAPPRAVTANGGRVMPAWFDIIEFSMDLNAPRQDTAGMLATARSFDALIAAEVEAGMPAERIVLGGFSQGAAMTLLTGLTTKHRLAGLVVMSGRLPAKDSIKEASALHMLSEHARKLPIWWGHGKQDPLVTFELGNKSREVLRTEMGIETVDSEAVLGGGVDFHAYDGLTHSTSMEELEDLQVFIRKVIPSTD